MGAVHDDRAERLTGQEESWQSRGTMTEQRYWQDRRNPGRTRGIMAEQGHDDRAEILAGQEESQQSRGTMTEQ